MPMHLPTGIISPIVSEYTSTSLKSRHTGLGLRCDGKPKLLGQRFIGIPYIRGHHGFGMRELGLELLGGQTATVRFAKARPYSSTL